MSRKSHKQAGVIQICTCLVSRVFQGRKVLERAGRSHGGAKSRGDTATREDFFRLLDAQRVYLPNRWHLPRVGCAGGGVNNLLKNLLQVKNERSSSYKR